MGVAEPNPVAVLEVERKYDVDPDTGPLDAAAVLGPTCGCREPCHRP
jgi:hypothetical protein